MSVSRKNAQAAQDYAEKKRLQLQKAKQLKEERKNSIQRVAENQIVGGSSQMTAGGYVSPFKQFLNLFYSWEETKGTLRT